MTAKVFSEFKLPTNVETYRTFTVNNVAYLTYTVFKKDHITDKVTDEYVYLHEKDGIFEEIFKICNASLYHDPNDPSQIYIVDHDVLSIHSLENHSTTVLGSIPPIHRDAIHFKKMTKDGLYNICHQIDEILEPVEYYILLYNCTFVAISSNKTAIVFIKDKYSYERINNNNFLVKHESNYKKVFFNVSTQKETLIYECVKYTQMTGTKILVNHRNGSLQVVEIN